MVDNKELPNHSPEGKDILEGSKNYPPSPERHDTNLPGDIQTPVPPLVSSLYDARVDTGAGFDPQVVQLDPNAHKIVNPLAGFDEYGTELRRDARVWKVYVEEADKYDKELVTGWKEQFDRHDPEFLIESSKKLQEDPVDASAQTLLVISQTLLALTNNTQAPETTVPPTSNIARFKPTKTAIWINALWYLSLSLSLATAFIGILAKEWCHSFLTGRTGHPFEQSERRQRKWDMIERWRMPELLAVLPSLIHVALFLFAIGLCIYLWDMHVAVSIPVVCVSGIAFGFYVWSSVSACRLDYFPYPTIISRIYHTEWAQRIVTAVSALMRIAYLILTLLVLPLLAQMAYMLLLIPFIPTNILPLPIILLDIIPNWITQFEPLPLDFTHSLRGVASAKELAHILLHGLYRYFIWKPAFVLHRVLEWVAEKWMLVLSHVYETGPSKLLDFTQGWISRIVTRTSGDEVADVTSQALSWLIKNCETPPSVDVALQSIAGANERISRTPLLECHATLQILQRLASSNLYREAGARTDAAVALYSRALSFLNAPIESNSNDKRNRTRSELEVLIWDLQTETEKKVANLITKDSFQPTQNNLDALRIGNTAASNSLKILKGINTDISVEKVLGLIAKLLELNLSNRYPLHQAALLSLVHAAVLLSLFAPQHAAASALPSLCVRLVQSHRRHVTFDFRISPSSQLLITNLAIACALLCDKYATQDRLNQPDGLSWSEDVVRGLILRHSQDQDDLAMISEFGQQELYTRQEAYELMNVDPDFQPASSTPIYLDAQTISKGEDAILPYLRALDSIYHLTPVGTLAPHNYYFILNVMCSFQDPSSLPWSYCERLISKCRFPSSPEGLLQVLLARRYPIIPLLMQMETASNPAQRFFAIGQLWLLYTLGLDSSIGPTDSTTEDTSSVDYRLSGMPPDSGPFGSFEIRDSTEHSGSAASFAESFDHDDRLSEYTETVVRERGRSLGSSRSHSRSRSRSHSGDRNPIRVRIRGRNRSQGPILVLARSRRRASDPAFVRDRKPIRIRIRSRNHGSGPIPIRIHSHSPSHARIRSLISTRGRGNNQGRSPARIRILNHKRNRSHSPIRIRVRSRNPNDGHPVAQIVHAGATNARSDRLYSTRSQLRDQLGKHRNSSSGVDAYHSSLAVQIEQIWRKRDRTIASSLGLWAYRLMECVSQAFNQPLSKQLHKALHDVPPELRGLDSFTGWRPHTVEAQTTEGVQNDLEENSGGASGLDDYELLATNRINCWGGRVIIEEEQAREEGNDGCDEVDGNHGARSEGNETAGCRFVEADGGSSLDPVVQGDEAPCEAHGSVSGGDVVTGGCQEAPTGGNEAIEVEEQGAEEEASSTGTAGGGAGTRAGDENYDTTNDGHVAIDVSEDTPIASEESLVEALLYVHIESNSSGSADRHGHLAEEIKKTWNQRDRSIATALGVWAYRLMECILQARNQPISKQIHKGLRGIPQELRGLCSFTEWRPQENETQIIEGESVDVQGIGDDIDAIAHIGGPNSQDHYTSSRGTSLDEAEEQDGGGDEGAGMNAERIIDERDEATEEELGNEGGEDETSEDENIMMDGAREAETNKSEDEDSPQEVASGANLLKNGECGAEDTESDSRRGLDATENLGRSKVRDGDRLET